MRERSILYNRRSRLNGKNFTVMVRNRPHSQHKGTMDNSAATKRADSLFENDSRTMQSQNRCRYCHKSVRVGAARAPEIHFSMSEDEQTSKGLALGTQGRIG